MTEMVALAPATALPLRRRVWRWSLKGIGGLCVGLGVVGLFLPLIPAFDFFLLAALCFANSSPVAYRWLTTNRLFGKRFGDYLEHRGATMTTKVTTLVVLWAGLVGSMLLVDLPHWAQATMIVIGVGVTWHVARLRSIRG